jgi:predicted transcriptional regulator
MWHMSNTLTVRLPAELRERLEALAQREDRSAGSVIRRAVSLYVDASDEVTAEMEDSDGVRVR